MVKLDLESKYSAPIKTALNKTEVNPYNQQPIKQDLKPMPKADFVPLANFVKSLPKQERVHTRCWHSSRQISRS